MKFLIQQVFAHSKPTYLIPEYLKKYTGRYLGLNKRIDSVGTIKKDLFSPEAFDGIEFDAANIGVLNSQNWELYLGRIRRFQEQGVSIESIHGMYPAGEKPEIDHPARCLNLGFLSGENVNGLKTHIRMTAAIIHENPILVLHPGIVPMSMTWAEAIDNVSNNLKLILTDLEKTKVTVCVENLAPPLKPDQFKVIGSDYNVLKEIVDRVNHPQVKIVYDWGHANASARVYYEENQSTLPEDYLSSFSYHKQLVDALHEHIVYVHLNYNLAHLKDFKAPHGFSKTGWDFHQGISGADADSLSRYREVLMELYFNSELRSHGGKILLEINPKGIMKFLGLGYVGATDQDALETAKLLREWFTEFEEIGKNKHAQ